MATFSNGESGLSVRTKINDVLQHADGTAGELVINEAGADVDFRVESDTNANALFVDGATGNVGIGTSSLNDTLQVNGGITIGKNGNAVLTLIPTYGSGGSIISFRASGSSSQDASIASGVGAVSNIVFYTGGASNSERMRIDASGNLAIGLTNPGTARLYVKGTGGTALETGDTTSTSGSSALRILGDTTGNFRELSFGVDNTAGYTWQRSFQQGVGAAAHAWFNWNTQAMTLGANGNLAIGTTLASSKLTVTGAGNSIGGTTEFNAEIVQENSTAKRGLFFGHDTSSQIGIVGANSGGVPSNLAFWTFNGATWGERMRIDASGNVGIGTSSPTAGKFVVAGSLASVYVNSGGNNLAFTYDGGNYISALGGSSACLIFDTGGGFERIRIDASGNLLVGTPYSGASKLRISGLPTSSAGLSAGDVWNDAGTLKIA